MPCRFWRSALRLMHKACPQGGHVIVTCFGGHGRTGTCLASILIAHSARTAQSAIDFIREKHCDAAIETTAQEEYLAWLMTDCIRQDERDRVEAAKKGEKKP